MTRERWEQVLFAHVPDEVVRDMLNAYVLELEAENARLRDELAKWERLTDGIDLPEYPVVQFAPKDLERENDRLRELVSILAHCAADNGCDSCPINGGCARVGELDLCETAHERMRELGVEP